MVVQEVYPPLTNIIPGGDVRESFWHRAGTRREARQIAAKNVLYAVQYYEQGQNDVLTPAGQGILQPGAGSYPSSSST